MKSKSIFCWSFMKWFLPIFFAGICAIYAILTYHFPLNKEAAQTKAENKQTKSSEQKLTVSKDKQVNPPSHLALETGKDSVVMGNVPPNTKVGDGSVVIGPTDNKGNTIINTPMAVGRGAKAGPGSIAIGADASANSSRSALSDNENKK